MTRQNVLAFLGKIENINSGGCGIAAVAIFRWLKRTDIDVYFGYNWFESYEINSDVLAGDPCTQPVAPAHVWLSVGGEVLDVYSGYTPDYWDYNHEVSIEFLIELAKQPNKWNPTFKRENIALIMHGIGVDLRDLISLPEWQRDARH